MVSSLVALGIVFALNRNRTREVERLTAQMADAPVADASSPTGYAGGMRVLLAPGHNNKSYQWIAQTQTMIATREWRVRHVDYDNAPAGRPVYSPSPYRWWLGGSPASTIGARGNRSAWVSNAARSGPIPCCIFC